MLLAVTACAESESSAGITATKETPTTAAPTTTTTTEPEPTTTSSGPGSTTGIIKLSVRDWSAVNGYRLLAVVWDESYDDLAGGAFWKLIDSDPFSDTDIVHPAFWGEDPPGVEYDSWGKGITCGMRQHSSNPAATCSSSGRTPVS